MAKKQNTETDADDQINLPIEGEFIPSDEVAGEEILDAFKRTKDRLTKEATLKKPRKKATRKKSTAKEKHPTPVRGFTVKYLNNLKPSDKRFEIADKACPGLRLRVQPTGTKSFIWYYKVNGKMKAVVLGKYPALKLADARKALASAKEKREEGISLVPAANTPVTVSDLAERFYERRIKPKRRRPEAVRQVLDHDILNKIGNRKLKMVTAPMLTDVVETVVDRGAAAHAGKVLAIIKQMFKYAEGQGYITHSPAYALERDNLGVVVNVRNRALDVDEHGEIDQGYPEIKAFWSAIDAAPKMSKQVCTALKLLLVLGVRSGELRQAEWDNVDFDNGVMVIPPEHQKLNPKQMQTARPWRVPLPDIAVELLHELHDYTGNTAYVIAGRGNAPITDKVLGRAMRRLFEMGLLTINPATPHDLRRTFRTHIDYLGVEPHVAEKCLNHSLGRIEATYNRNDILDQRRAALQLWADRLHMVLNPSDKVAVLA